MVSAPPSSPVQPARHEQRLHQIARARLAVLRDGNTLAGGLSESWIARSWQRCLANGQKPEQTLLFESLSAQAMRRTEEANYTLASAARPILQKLGETIALTRYFALLTNADGVVIDVTGQIDRQDRRADLISRIGVDLSETRVGTTAIGAALTELAPVWLHRGEHFFDANSAYSCAGAPLFGPHGNCVGMLDVTGIDAMERPELKHLVIQAARSIENALIPNSASGLLVRLNWVGASLGADTDGLIGLDRDGFVTGANPAARQMVPQLPTGPASPLHCSDLFAMPEGMLFDAAAQGRLGYAPPIEMPLWSGLRLHGLPVLQSGSAASRSTADITDNVPVPLRDVESALIRKAVEEAKGNVMKAARMLGVSRATVYRRLGKAKARPGTARHAD